MQGLETDLNSYGDKERWLYALKILGCDQPIEPLTQIGLGRPS